MNLLTMDNAIFIRITFFFSIFVLMALVEIYAPKRALTVSKVSRWCVNIVITFLNSLLVQLLIPAGAVGLAILAEIKGWGLFNSIGVERISAGISSILIFDFIIYVQHVVFHRFGFLWRLHMMHHTDLDIDVTTGARFHPVEILLSMLIKMGCVIVIGPPAWSIVTFEILLNGTSMFNHSNISLPRGLDRILRLFVVTPDMHRVHHSVLVREMNSNYGFNLPWWDRLCGTYRDQPREGHERMTIGLANFRQQERLKIHHLLALPMTVDKTYIASFGTK